MVRKKKEEEVEIPLLNRIPEARYFLAKYVANFQTAKEMYNSVFDHADRNSEPVFQILDVLDGPELPDGLPAGDYFVIKTERKFKVTAHVPETIYATTELKP